MHPVVEDVACRLLPVDQLGDEEHVVGLSPAVVEAHQAGWDPQPGLAHLARLLASPGREFHVLDLVAVEAGNPVSGEEGAEAAHLAFGDAGETLDAKAKQAYRRRLAEIDDDIDNARAAGDHVRETHADAEREFLIAERSRAVGLGGRDRRTGSASERARAGVTRAIRQAIARINEHQPDLGQHLERAIRTGTYCSYLPDTRVPSHWDP